MRRSQTAHQLGQAGIDYLGAVLAIALLCTAAVVAITQLRPAGGAEQPSAVVAQPLTPLVDLLGRREPTGRAGGLAAGVRRSVRFVARGPKAFGRGFVDALVRDAQSLVRHPLQAIGGAGGELHDVARDPIGTLRARWDAGRAYVRDLRALGIRRGYEQLMYDLGGLGEDVVVARGKRALLERATTRRRPAPRRPNGTQRPDVTN